MQSVSFENSLLAALPADLQGTACERCDRRQSNWHLRSQDGLYPICSLCVLYVIDWDKKDPVHLAEFITFVSAQRLSPFRFGKDGRLTDVRDADAIIASLVMTSNLIGLLR